MASRKFCLSPETLVFNSDTSMDIDWNRTGLYGNSFFSQETYLSENNNSIPSFNHLR